MLARAWWVAIYEWRLIRRSRTFWVLAALLTALAWFVLEWPDLPRKNAFLASATAAEFLGLLSSLLFIFLATPIWLREFQPGYDMLWSRAVSSGTYFIGKVLGIAMAATMALLPAISLMGAVTIGVFGPHSIKSLAYTLAIILVPAVAVTLAVSAFVSLLFRHWLWTYLTLVALRAGIATGIGMLQLTNFTLQGVYLSPLVGFGPDTQLVIWNRCFYIAFAFTLVSTVALVFPYWELRTQRPNRLGQMALAVISLSSLVWAVQSASNFQAVARQAQLPNQLGSSETTLAEAADYHLSVIIDLRRNHLSGEATLALSDTSIPIFELPLNLNPGLQIQQVLSGDNTKIHWEGGKVIFNSPIIEGQNLSLTVKYEGRLIVNPGSYDIFLSQDERSPLPGGYLGQGTAHLLRSGNWYPFANLWSPDQLDITVLGDEIALVSTADRVFQVAGGQNLTWFGSLADPLLAVSSSYQQALWPEATILYPIEYEHLLERVIAPYVSIARQMDKHLRPTPLGPLRVAVVPLIERSEYDSTTGVLFLSEEVFKHYRSNFYYGGVSRDAIYQRWAAEAMTRVWWCQEHQCLSLPPNIGFKSEPSGDAVTETLLSYIALRLTESRQGTVFVTEEVKDRVKVTRSPELLVYSPYPNLGISPSLFVRLDYLWNLFGPERFWKMVSAYEANYGGQQPPSLEEFETFIQTTINVSLPPFDQGPNSQ